MVRLLRIVSQQVLRVEIPGMYLDLDEDLLAAGVFDQSGARDRKVIQAEVSAQGSLFSNPSVGTNPATASKAKREDLDLWIKENLDDFVPKVPAHRHRSSKYPGPVVCWESGTKKKRR